MKEAGDSLLLAQEALGRLKEVTKEKINHNLITHSLDRREAVLSNRIEGTQANIEELLDYEVTQDEEGARSESKTVFDYLRALHYGLRELESKNHVSLELIQGVHKVLMKNDEFYKDEPGRFRSVQNWIGGLRIQDAKYVPPSPEEVLGEMKKLESFINNEDESFMSIVLRSAIAHAQFEAIHPFRDGNGRLGRILIPLMLKREGYPPLYVAGELYNHRTEYFDALLDVQLRLNWGRWVKFFADCVTHSCEKAIFTAHLLLEKRSSWNEMTSSIRSDSVVHKITDLLLSHPVLDAKMVSKLIKCSYPSANNALSALVGLNILSTDDRKRNRVFVANDVIEILKGKAAATQRKMR